MNEWAAAGIPFIFLIDFELKKPRIFRVDDIDPANLLYYIDGVTNCRVEKGNMKKPELTRHPEKYQDYLKKFYKVRDEIADGNTYLINLTCSTPVELNLTLKEVFLMSKARYKVWYEDQFVCFSPETFVTIKDGIIRSFPMKGTIDASIPGAEDIILSDRKETAEHYTIVDLIRNDLSMVSSHVRVERFRFTDRILTNGKNLIQVVSEVCGDLEKDYLSAVGDIIFSLLPAGSVSGAPKRETARIIAETEKHDRGYYTGVFGIFDGKALTSSVLIRYIENKPGGLFYRSGGGITSFSKPESEYEEMIDKIYVPVI